MASTNQSPQYQEAERKYLMAKDLDEQIFWLKDMIKECPKRKSSEKMLANLKNRLRKLTENLEKQKKSGKSSKASIRKAEMQAIIVGLTNSGKSSLLNSLTNANPKISELPFTTIIPEIATMDYNHVKIQIIELPAIDTEYTDKSLLNNADSIIVLINSIEDLEKIKPFLAKTIGKQIIAYNKIDLLNENEKRKLIDKLKSKRIDAFLISAKTKENLNELSEKIFKSFNKIRIYLKEPNKKSASEIPMIAEENSTVKNIAEKIFHGFSDTIKETRIWGPSSKFAGQGVGLNHILKDKDIVEFKTK